MHWQDGVVAVIAAAAGVLAARAQLRATEISLRWRLAIAVMAGVGMGSAVLAAATSWLAQAGDPWNAARLAPAIALHQGYRLYYPSDAGPVLSTVVGPVAFLAYWPIGFLRGSPTSLILTASAANLLAFALIVRALLQRVAATPAVAVLAALSTLQLALLYPSLRYSLFCVHADAPALALTALGLIALLPAAAPLSWRRAGGAALCFALAVWAKHSLVPLFPAVLVLLWARDGRSAALRFLTAGAAIGMAVPGVFVIAWGADVLWLNLVTIPSSHPWVQISLADGERFPHLHATTAAARGKVVLAATLHMVRQSWPLFALFAALFVQHRLRRAAGEPRWPRSAWAHFAFAAVALLPSAAIGRVKVGGEVNHESFTVFFLVLALACWLAEERLVEARLRLARAACVAGVLFLITFGREWDYPGWTAAWSNQNEDAYHYDRAHPGRVYFPWNPLTSLLAEGKLWHFDYGVFDRNLGGARVSPEHLAAALPAPRPIIATTTAHHDYILRTYFPEYVPLRADPGLPGWQLYGPRADAADASRLKAAR